MSERKFSMNQGAYLGFILVGVALLEYIIGIIDIEKPVLVWLINTGIIIMFLWYTIQRYRDDINEGFLSYAQSLKIGVSIVVFASFIFGIWKVLLINFIMPDYPEIFIQSQEERMIEMEEMYPSLMDGFVDLDWEKIEEEAYKSFRPHTIMINEIISKAIGGFMISLIISFFTKRVDKNIIT